MANDLFAIDSYKRSNDMLENGIPFKTHVKAYKNGKCIYDDSVECVFSHSHGYDQDEITIEWNLNESTRNSLGLRCLFNTNFQEFQYRNGVLIIKAIPFVIEIEDIH